MHTSETTDCRQSASPGNQIPQTLSNRRLAAVGGSTAFANAFRPVQNTPPRKRSVRPARLRQWAT